ncbi:MAG: hypothetical protein IJC53_05215 [Clostridia bacterium]|nr:hypothetical protein [Clostridia bacterium]
MKETVKQKLTSRKFWAALISFVTAIITYCGTSGEIEAVSCILWAAASLVAYIVGEGLVDAARGGEKDAQNPEP